MASSWPSMSPALPGFAQAGLTVQQQAGARGVTPLALYPASEYEEMRLKMNPPRVSFDNDKHPKYTHLQVHSANRYGCLLEVVQLLTDLGLIIVKGFISSDGGWFVDEFFVTDSQGKKIIDEGLLAFIQQALGARTSSSLAYAAQQQQQSLQQQQLVEEPASPWQGQTQGDSSVGGLVGLAAKDEQRAGGGLGVGSAVPLMTLNHVLSSGVQRSGAFPADPRNAAAAGLRPAVPSVRIEMMGKDRPGLLSEISAVLAEYHCNIVDAQVWTHNLHVACVVHIIPDCSVGAVGPASLTPGRTIQGSLVDAPAHAVGHVAWLTSKLRHVMQGEGEEAVSASESSGSQEGSLSNMEKARGEVEWGLMPPPATPVPAGASKGRSEDADPSEKCAVVQGGGVPGAGTLGPNDTAKLIAMAMAVTREQRRENTPSPSPSTGHSPSDSGGAMAVWTLDDNDLGPSSLGVLYAGAKSAAARQTEGLETGFCSPQGWTSTACSTKLERRLHQLLAASEGLQEERLQLSASKACPWRTYGTSSGNISCPSWATETLGIAAKNGGVRSSSANSLEIHGMGLQSRFQSSSGSVASSSSTSSNSGSSSSSVSTNVGVCAGMGPSAKKCSTLVTVGYNAETGYSILTIRCKDRPRLLFDCVCTLTDMGYVVYHGTIDTEEDIAFQEYYTRRLNGGSVLEEGEQERIRRALDAAIERRRPVEDGICVQVSGKDRVGLLSDLTKAFHRHKLTVVSATVSTKGANVIDNFVVSPTVVPPLSLPLPHPIQPGRDSLAGSVISGKAGQTKTHPSGLPAQAPTGDRSLAILDNDLGQHQQQTRKMGLEAEEEYVKRVVEEIRKELGGVAEFKVKPVCIPSPPKSSHGPTGLSPLSGRVRSLSSSENCLSTDEWSKQLLDSSHGSSYGSKTGMDPSLYSKEQPTLAQVFMQQSGRLLSSFGFGRNR